MTHPVMNGIALNGEDGGISDRRLLDWSPGVADICASADLRPVIRKPPSTNSITLKGFAAIGRTIRQDRYEVESRPLFARRSQNDLFDRLPSETVTDADGSELSAAIDTIEQRVRAGAMLKAENELIIGVAGRGEGGFDCKIVEHDGAVMTRRAA